MRYKIFYNFFLTLLAIGYSIPLNSQVENDTTELNQDRLEVINANNMVAIKETNMEIDSLRDQVIFHQDGAFMYCDTAILINKVDLLAWGNVTIVQHDTVEIFADTLRYNAENRLAQLRNRVILDNEGDQLKTDILDYQMDTKMAYYYSGAVLRNVNNSLRSQIGSFDTENGMAYFGRDVQLLRGNLKLRTDSMIYDRSDEEINFIGPTRIVKDSADIYCEEGFFDLDEDQGRFAIHAQYSKNDTLALADEIFYDGMDQSYLLEGNARYSTSKEKATAFTMTFNQSSGDMLLRGQAQYMSQDQFASGHRLQLNTKTEVFSTFGRSKIEDKNVHLSGEEIIYNQAHDNIGYAYDEVVWIDSANQTTILTDQLVYSDSLSFSLALVENLRPLMIKKLKEGDSLFLSADTLFSAEDILGVDTLSRFDAYRHVKFYKENLQGVADSLHFDNVDSSFVMYGSPVMWSDSSQYTADTIIIKMKNGDIKSLTLSSNAFIAIEEQVGMYHQIKGNVIIAYFENEEIVKMDVIGNGEMIYYMKDEDDAYIGSDNKVCEKMHFYYKNGELDNIDFLVKPISTIFPMDQIDIKTNKLDGFSWKIALRPLSKEELR